MSISRVKADRSASRVQVLDAIPFTTYNMPIALMAELADVAARVTHWSMTRSRIFYGWWIVILGALINAVGGGILYHCFTIFFLPLKRDFGVSSAAISLLYGASRLEGGVEGPAVGYLIDRFGPRVMIFIGVGLAGIGLILLATVQSFLAFALVYILVVSLGHGSGFYVPVSVAVNTWFIRRRAVGFGIITAATSIGAMVMAPVLSHIVLNSGWRMGAIVAGVIILGVAIPAALPIQRSPELRGLHPDGRLTRANHADESQPASLAAREVDFTVRQALRTTSYWLLASGITLRLLVTTALSAHFVPVLVWRGMSEATAAYLVSLLSFSMIISTLLMGWAGDRWNKAMLSSAGTIALIVGMLGLALSQDSVYPYAFTVGFAITMGTTPLNWSLVGDLFGRRSYGTLRGIMGVGYGIATFLSPIYAGWVFDNTGSYSTVLIIFSAILLTSAALFGVLGQRLARKG